jgi:hypothetical protein
MSTEMPNARLTMNARHSSTKKPMVTLTTKPIEMRTTKPMLM